MSAEFAASGGFEAAFRMALALLAAVGLALAPAEPAHARGFSSLRKLTKLTKAMAASKATAALAKGARVAVIVDYCDHVTAKRSIKQVAAPATATLPVEEP